MSRPVPSTSLPGVTPLRVILPLVFLASLGTGVFWNAIAFVAKHEYGFGQVRTLALTLAMGVLYTVGAFTAGRLLRRVERFAVPRTVLVAVTIVQGALCTLPVVTDGEWALWATTLGVSITSSIQWPLIESYVAAGRHGAAMRSAIGWFNIVWMIAVFVPLLLMAPIIERHAEWAIGGQVLAALLALVPLARFAPRPGTHDPTAASASVPAGYRDLLRSARVLLPLSYLLFAAMGPILPYKLAAIGTDVHAETPAASTWMIVRVLAVAAMGVAGFWHGRWGALLFGGLAMAGGFAAVLLAPSLVMIVAGLALFGAGVGVVYYAALYYVMAVGHAGVDASGTHEGLIGAGYAAGPAAGLAGVAIARLTGVPHEPCIVVFALALIAFGAIFAVRPYLAARAARPRRNAIHR